MWKAIVFAQLEYDQLTTTEASLTRKTGIGGGACGGGGGGGGGGGCGGGGDLATPGT